jgi:hypothetical protein
LLTALIEAAVIVGHRAVVAETWKCSRT